MSVVIMTIRCNECGSVEYTKAGFSWRERKKVQRYRCFVCGKVFVPTDEELKDNSEVKGGTETPRR